MHPEQQRYWTTLLNLQRLWPNDEAAIGIIPPRHREFESPPAWPYRKAQAYLLNNLDLLRANFEKLEAGEPLDYDLINHALSDLTIRLHPWPSLPDLKAASRAKQEVGGRLETLQVRAPEEGMNAGTRYVRATIQRSFYYFALYVDHRLADPAYPDVSPTHWSIRESDDGSADLVLCPPKSLRTDVAS